MIIGPRIQQQKFPAIKHHSRKQRKKNNQLFSFCHQRLVGKVIVSFGIDSDLLLSINFISPIVSRITWRDNDGLERGVHLQRVRGVLSRKSPNSLSPNDRVVLHCIVRRRDDYIRHIFCLLFRDKT